jgi:hypothetical protein
MTDIGSWYSAWGTGYSVLGTANRRWNRSSKLKAKGTWEKTGPNYKGQTIGQSVLGEVSFQFDSE